MSDVGYLETNCLLAYITIDVNKKKEDSSQTTREISNFSGLSYKESS